MGVCVGKVKGHLKQIPKKKTKITSLSTNVKILSSFKVNNWEKGDKQTYGSEH